MDDADSPFDPVDLGNPDLRVVMVDSDSLQVSDMGVMPYNEAETATIELRRSDEINGWRDVDPYGQLVAAIDPDLTVSPIELLTTVMGIHFAERLPWKRIEA